MIGRRFFGILFFSAILLGSSVFAVANASNDSFTVNSSILTRLNVTGNDTGNGTLLVGQVSTPQHGTVAINGDGTLNYTSTQGYLGNDSFNYTVTESNSLYSNDTGHYYEFVSASGITWQNANLSANNRTLYGLQGYLATITSAAENAFAQSKLSGQGWMGASDAAVEGSWYWVTGPEAGEQFWQGTSSGSVVNGMYNNWNSGEPNNAGDEDYAHFLTDGHWNDYAFNNPSIQGYMVEYGGMPGDTPAIPTGFVTIHVVDQAKPSAQLNSPAAGYYNDTSGNVSITFNCSATDNYNLGSLNLYLTNPQNQSFALNQTNNVSGTSNSTSWTMNFGNGNYTWGCFANDSNGNTNWSATNRSFVINFTDTDNDGIADYLDTLGWTTINASGSGVSNLNITVNGTAANGSFSGVQQVVISDGSSPFVNFTFNFSSSSLDLSKVSFVKSDNGLIVNMSGQLQARYNKTVYINDNSFVSLCVKDADIQSLSEITSGCNGANETDFTSCLGGNATINNISCVESNHVITISNLAHSGVVGAQAPQYSGGSSCYSMWSCTDWSSCLSGLQTRSCTDRTHCYMPLNKPAENQSCTCTEQWGCTDWSACSNGQQTRSCTDAYACPNPANAPAETQSCACTEQWSCGAWSSCTNGQQTRSCTDASACPNPANKPTESQTCACIEQWSCGAWSDCSGGQETRNCTDTSSCGTTQNKPFTTQSCASPNASAGKVTAPAANSSSSKQPPEKPAYPDPLSCILPIILILVVLLVALFAAKKFRGKKANKSR